MKNEVTITMDELGTLINLAAKEMMQLRGDDIYVPCGAGTYYRDLEIIFNKYSDLFPEPDE